jgi:7-keto-8-aminopelargonate synthetase-like enzyme
MALPPELSAAARRVIGRLARFPWLWDRLDEELQDFGAKKAHGSIIVDFEKPDETVTLKLAESYGDVKDVDVTVIRKVRKP